MRRLRIGGDISLWRSVDQAQPSCLSAWTSFQVLVMCRILSPSNFNEGIMSHASDITYMGPNGIYLVGWKDIEKEWDAQAANELGGKVVAKRMHQVIGSDLAVVNCIESGENIINGKQKR
jgi:hypothetical protein